MARSRAFQKVNPISREETEATDRIDLLRCRAGLLTGKDGALVQMYLNGTGTLSQMARLAGVNEANVARRIHKLVRRLLDGQYITCLRSRDKFTQEQIEIARDYFVDGLPMSEIAWRRDISYYSVRRTLKKIQRLTTVTRTHTDRNAD
jgi:predicted DNA-binding protein YlxM (UPF0122 family)